MRYLSILVALVLLAVIAVPSYDAYSDDDYLRISEVMPYGQSEGISLRNYGNSTVDLRDYRIEDGEGSISFTLPLTVGPGSSVTILRNLPDRWIRDRNILTYDGNGIVSKKFQLNDKGDEVTLRTSKGVLIDAFVYGEGSLDEGWNGPSFASIPSNCIAVRISMIDTDSAKDWTVAVPGRTSLTETSYLGKVTPFVFPDSKGHPLIDAIGKAESEVLVSVYILDHPDIVYVLSKLSENGVRVMVLIEGAPSGGVPDQEKGMMEFLKRSGSQVLVMKNVEGFRRYSYLHNKFAVIDSQKVVVTSENWRESSFGNNRGWGAIVESAEYGEYMRNVFFDDADIRFGDVHRFEDVYPNVLPLRPSANGRIEWDTYPSFDCIVYPMVCPDFAFDPLVRLISGAEERVFAQQMTVDMSWLSDWSPLMAMELAYRNGADCRLIVDVTFDSPYDDDPNDGYLIKEMADIRVKTGNDTQFKGMIHNKGLIVDDSVWIGSMNWNHASFGNNREMGVLISSPEVADIYASYFIGDWGGFSGTVELRAEARTVSGGSVVLDASSSSVPSGILFEWDLDSDGTADRSGEKIVAEFPEGLSICTLWVTDEDGVTHTLEVRVFIEPRSMDLRHLKYLPIVILCIMILVHRAIRKRKCNDDKGFPPERYG